MKSLSAAKRKYMKDFLEMNAQKIKQEILTFDNNSFSVLSDVVLSLKSMANEFDDEMKKNIR